MKIKYSYSLIPVILILILMTAACKDKINDSSRQKVEDDGLTQEAEGEDESLTQNAGDGDESLTQESGDGDENLAKDADGQEEDPTQETKDQDGSMVQSDNIGDKALMQKSEGDKASTEKAEEGDRVPAQGADKEGGSSSPEQTAQAEEKPTPTTAAGGNTQDSKNSDNHSEEQQDPMEEAFYYQKLNDEIKERINGKSYGEDCKIPYSDLRYVRVLHYGFDGEVHEGELIVNKAIAQDIIDIFKELYEAEYPIEKMVLVDEYDADDDASMEDNNTSSFNYRVVEGTDRISKHGYGLAIDVNPLYNPYIHSMNGETVITPVNGVQYADRSLDCEYYIKKGDVCYEAFVKRGFTWGGSWKNSKDYQHFQKEPE